MSAPASAHFPGSSRGSFRGNFRGRVVIAGVGLLTPLGDGAWPTFRALLAGRTLADRTAELPEDIAPVDLVRAIGGVSCCRHTSTDPAVDLAERAAREAAAEAGVELAGLPTWVGTSKGAVGRMSNLAWGISHVDQDRALAVALGPHGYLNHHLMRRTGIDIRGHTVAACASSLIALDQARRYLLHSPLNIQPSSFALVLTAEAALTPLFIHSYRRLGVLAPLTPAGYRQRPLDQRRQGFMLTEVGAAIVLRRLEPDQLPGEGEMELVTTATATDAYDLIRPNPRMDAVKHVFRCLLQHEHARMPDVIHPHAPGTTDHDEAELAAYREEVGYRRQESGVRSQEAGARDQHTQTPASCPLTSDLYAVKGALGHGLGAAGLTALVIAALCLRTGQRPPMPWLDAPLPHLPPAALSPAPVPCPRTGCHAVFASGFAGHTAGALIRRH